MSVENERLAAAQKLKARYQEDQDEELIQHRQRDQRARAFHLQVRWGLLWIGAGVILTGVTYALAPGGTYFVFWGAIVYGLYKILKAAVMKR